MLLQKYNDFVQITEEARVSQRKPASKQNAFQNSTPKSKDRQLRY